MPRVQLSGPDASAPPGTTPKTLLLLCCMMKSVTHTTLGEIDTAIEFHQRAMAIANEAIGRSIALARDIAAAS